MPQAPRPPVAPYLTVTPAAAAIAFYASAFGAVQKALMPALDGMRIMHCELEINGGTVMLSDAFPEVNKTRPPVPNDYPTSPSALNCPARRLWTTRRPNAQNWAPQPRWGR